LTDPMRGYVFVEAAALKTQKKPAYTIILRSITKPGMYKYEYWIT